MGRTSNNNMDSTSSSKQQQVMTTPHDLAMRLGPWCLFCFVLGPVVIGIWTYGWFGVIIFFFLFGIALIEPTCYWQYVITCHALYVKYATQGVRLQGIVTRTWITTEGDNNVQVTHIQVMYAVDDYRNTKDFRLTEEQARESSSTVVMDLIVMPGYPKSAIMEASVKDVDPDFPPDGTDWLYLAILLTIAPPTLAPTIFLFFPLLEISTWIATLLFVLCTFLFVIVMDVLAFTFAYWFATKLRDRAFHSLLFHGAKPIYEDARMFSPEEQQQPGSYDDFCHSTPKIRPSYRTILQIAVKATLWAVYFGMFFGGYLIWYALAIPVWKRRLLQRYDTESDTSCVIGSVVSKQLQVCKGGLIVQYNTVDDNENNQLVSFKKRIQWPPAQVFPRQLDIPDSLELTYLKDSPESAIYIYKGPLEHLSLAQKSMRVFGWVFSFLICIFIVCFQIAIPLVVFCSTRESAYWVGGILLTCHLVLGFPGVWIRFQTVVQKEILHGAKLIVLE
jgi:hypothetical protein